MMIRNGSMDNANIFDRVRIEIEGIGYLENSVVARVVAPVESQV